MMSTAAPPRPNLVPTAYRGVAVTEVTCELDEASLAAHFIGLEAYRRTRFIVVRRGQRTAVIAVEKDRGADGEDPLFALITAVTLLVEADDCAFVVRPDVDTAVPTALGRAALGDAPGKRGVVVQGTYGHISFIVDPAPLRLTVREVVPPYPPKLYDQTRRLLDVAEHLPPIELVAEVVELTDLARSRPSNAYLLPCRGGGVTVEGVGTSYLDERPERQSWTLIGCERSQQIHHWFYGERAEQVDICPRKAGPTAGAVLTKCCLFEREIVAEPEQVVVPWGASLAQISEALTVIAGAWEPSWAPA
ncbi:MAG TPA: hypothetical protein VK585_07525 [Jiangellaceae bacterium]|nr:hypothetical protein [Jiangellaceae bacterium]